MINAEKGCPINSKISVTIDARAIPFDTATVVKVLRRIRIRGMEMITIISRNGGCLFSSLASTP